MVLDPHGNFLLTIPMDEYVFTAQLQRCADETFNSTATLTVGDFQVEYNPSIQRVEFVNGSPQIVNATDLEIEEYLIRHGVYLFTVIDETSRTYRFLETKHFEDFVGETYFRFNSKCPDAKLNVSWRSKI